MSKVAKTIGVLAVIAGLLAAKEYWPALAASALINSADQVEFTFPEPDPDPQFVKLPKAGQSYGCDPLARANVFDNRYSKKATIWASQSTSNVAIRVSDDGKRLFLMTASDVKVGLTDPQEFQITSNTNYYMVAEQRFTLGMALMIFDVKTMKMVWTFNGQGMLGMKGESALYQCP
jgi:hypothetical protein